jgi:adenine-specific DNA-methyltransferase
MTASEVYLDLGFDKDVQGREPASGAVQRPAEAEPRGVVYTRRWVADLILDLAGYQSEQDLAPRYAVEPAAGQGAFLVPMIRRLLASLKIHGRQLDDARDSICAYELDAESARQAAELAVQELQAHGVAASEARILAAGWVRTGDYLLGSPGGRRADFVVGNPPYIRYDDIAPDVLRTYRDRYPTMVGRGDIYVGFIEAGLRQLAAGGVLGFICADRWMRAAYGAELRRLVSAAFGVEAVIEMHEAPVFENEVSAYPAIIIIRRGPQRTALVASADARAGEPASTGNLARSLRELSEGQTSPLPGFRAAQAQHWYQGPGPWPSLEPDRVALLQLLEARFGPLEDQLTGTRIGIGVATGADRVFITTDQDAAEPSRMVPLAMAADTRDGALRWSGHYLVDPWQAGGGLVDLNAYPRLRAYLTQWRGELQGRYVARRTPHIWYRTIDPVHHDLARLHKLYFVDMKSSSQPVLDRGETYPHHNLYYLTSTGWDLEVLGGLLMSRVAQLFIEAYCVRMRGGTLRFQAQYLRRIRVPAPEALSEDQRTRLRRAFLTRDTATATEAAIDAYGISQFAGQLTGLRKRSGTQRTSGRRTARVGLAGSRRPCSAISSSSKTRPEFMRG